MNRWCWPMCTTDSLTLCPSWLCRYSRTTGRGPRPTTCWPAPPSPPPFPWQRGPPGGPLPLWTNPRDTKWTDLILLIISHRIKEHLLPCGVPPCMEQVVWSQVIKVIVIKVMVTVILDMVIVIEGHLYFCICLFMVFMDVIKQRFEISLLLVFMDRH